jgi:MFS family permease
MRSLSFIVLMNVGTSYEMMILFAVIYGIFDYSTVPPTASLVASHLGLRIMGLAMGLISGGHALGGAVGALAGGYLFDLFARYTEMWWLAFGTAVLAGVMVFLLRKTERKVVLWQRINNLRRMNSRALSLTISSPHLFSRLTHRNTRGSMM